MQVDTTNRSPLGVDEFVVARELGLSVHTIRKDRVRDRRIPFYRIGTAVRYNLDRVREALVGMEVGGPAARPAKQRA